MQTFTLVAPVCPHCNLRVALAHRGQCTNIGCGKPLEVENANPQGSVLLLPARKVVRRHRQNSAVLLAGRMPAPRISAVQAPAYIN